MFEANTRVDLLVNLPFNSYKNVRLFDNVGEQVRYFDSFVGVSSVNHKYQRVNASVIKFHVNATDIANVNYLRFQNSKYADKWFYAFVREINYINAGASEIVYELDIFQTWLFDFNLRTSYIERQHVRRYIDGKPTINTIDEGLDYGSEYETVNVKNIRQVSNLVWVIIVASEDLQLGDVGGVTLSDIPTPLFFHAVPFTPGSGVPITINNKPVSSISTVFRETRTNPNLVGKIVSMFYTSFLPFDLTYSNRNITCAALDVQTGNNLSLAYINPDSWVVKDYNQGGKYLDLPKYEESKLLMYPYSIVELADYKGSMATLKLENIYNDDLIISHRGSIGTSPKNMFMVRHYNNKRTYYLPDFGIIDSDPNDITIIDDYSASYIQANKNSVSLANSQALSNASRMVNQNNATFRVQNAQKDQMQSLGAIETAGSFIGNLMSLNIGGAINTGVNATKNMINNSYDRKLGDMNNQYQNENLMVNAEQQIAMSNAKMQDINNMPATIGQLGNNGLFTMGNRFNGVYLIYKTVTQEYAEKLTNYFKMFGYRVNSVELPKIKTRKSFNYIKTIDVNIEASIPQNHLQILKSIFNNGVTLWHINDMYNYDVDNSEI